MTKQRVGLLTAWFLATFLAVGVASQAIGLVADRAVDFPVQVPVAVAGQSSLGPLTAGPAQHPEPSTSTTLETNPTASPTSATTGSLPAGSTTTTVPANQSTTTLTTSTTSTTSSTTLAATTTTTTAPVLDSGSFVATGGQVTAACTGLDTVKLLGAVPVAGWSLEVKSEGPVKVRVDFESGSQETEIEIQCSNGQLSAEISE